MNALSLKDRVSELLPIVRKNDTAQSIITFLAERARHRTDTDLKRLKYDLYHAALMVDEREYEAFWEELSKVGHVGELIRATVVDIPVMKNGKPVTKNGKPVIKKTARPAKFHWKFSCRQFGEEMQRALQAAGVNTSKQSTSLARLEGKKEAKATKSKSAQVDMRISLGNAKVYVPHGFTKADAQAISKKLTSLAK